MYIVAATLPFLNERLSKVVHDEAYTPNSRFGQAIVFILLALGPTAGILGAALSAINERRGNGVIGASVLGLFLHFLFVWGEVALAHQALDKRPWKRAVGQ